MSVHLECSRCRQPKEEREFLKNGRVLSCCEDCREKAREYQRERRRTRASPEDPLRRVGLARAIFSVNEALCMAAMHIVGTDDTLGTLKARTDLSFFRDIEMTSASRGACPICIGLIEEGENVPAIPCGHHFHYSCLIFHAASSPPVVSCPLCRGVITEREEKGTPVVPKIIERMAHSVMLLTLADGGVLVPL